MVIGGEAARYIPKQTIDAEPTMPLFPKRIIAEEGSIKPPHYGTDKVKANFPLSTRATQR